MNDIKATELTINGVTYVPKGSESAPIKTGPESIIRTYSAGVHIGTVLNRTGTEVELINARRLWFWNGAFTLNEVATKGVDREGSRISAAVPCIILTQAVEIIPIAEGVDLSSTEK
jgi:hypothetical protein